MMVEITRRTLIAALAGAALVTLAGPALAAGPEIYLAPRTQVALGGYDAVSYFGGGAPQKGSPDFTHEWKGAVWHFASAENRDKFKASPEAFAPQYGGHCAFAVARGYRAAGDPLAYRVVDGKLYLNLDRNVQRQWERDIPGEIKRGDVSWPKLIK